ncbi:sigma-70 family RNA polymerase sigma factor [Streptomyces sp. SID8366]|uniref:sigma-70 family RNA polymerase sigma factor n=1 Tax=unclassified Streptomyces TaxID=2593676 RepID=UPI000DB98405|nr:sigma-70 family RNA polymerase sigma factor [Streptomyces sp. PsTaAH-130]MYU08137.1 sigma-70 family RNA polymerase sigma factor [Streptomyces sp. SID8366]MYU65533.1 sigma-70 family RNA polymerase sigma factor [Streptomyces sp. SID69]RAJ59336.1 RNA polymerase sigma-70 factor (ECF subfamily) [Streptomyces sp. PsTaAH-130]
MPITVEDFEAARPQLLSVAHRMLGSVHDAQDAVQTAWLRAAAGHGAQPVENPAGWLTTVTARICLDELRARRRRGETPLLADAIPAEQLSADEAVLRAENVSRALLVLLERLTPPQRVAYVLHDLFAVPFDRVAQVLDGTVLGAKKHASRARQRLRSPAPAAEHRQAPDREIVEAFLAAARTGDTRAMLRLLAPDSVRDADAALLPPGARTVVTGATAIATETVRFADRIRATCPLTVNGAPAHLIAPGGHPLAVLHVGTDRGRVTRITLRPVRPADVFTARAEP